MEQKNNCIICKIMNKTMNSFLVYEDDHFIAFLDIRPLFYGHTLLAPKNHFQTIFDLPINLGENLLRATQLVGNAIKKATHAEGLFIASNNSVSQSIPHLHLHLVPRNKGDGLKGFFWPRQKYESDMHMIEIQEAIKKEL